LTMPTVSGPAPLSRPAAQPAGAASAPLARMRDQSSGIWPGRCRARDTASAAPRRAAPAAAPRTAARAPRFPVSAAPATAPSTLALRTCCLRLGPLPAPGPRSVATVVTYRPRFAFPIDVQVDDGAGRLAMAGARPRLERRGV